jgi:quinolinate synthase
MEAISTQIDEIRRKWGERLLILGHHYQRQSVLQHADEIGDSLELAKKAASHEEAERIMFCGVRFMAETADILSGERQTVYMPFTLAGCPMANMAEAKDMMVARERLGRVGGAWLPVVYVNSTAEIKACCGRLGGSACTSSNAKRVFEWVFSQHKRVFFLPDEHLGWNTAHDMGIADSDVLVYDQKQADGGLSDAEIARARVVVWKGFCLVHTAFTVEHVRKVRAMMPEAKIIVHPETPKEVLRLADAHGSTSQIIKYVESAAPGSTIVIGTENNLVERLADTFKGKLLVKALAPSVCANMARTNEENLLSVLTNWPAANEIHVPPDMAADAHKCLEQMLKL